MNQKMVDSGIGYIRIVFEFESLLGYVLFRSKLEQEKVIRSRIICGPHNMFLV